MGNFSFRFSYLFIQIGFIIFLPRIAISETEQLVARRCENDLSTILPSPYNVKSTTLTCTAVWSTFVIQYSQNKDNLVNIIVSAIYKTGWVGMGFSDNGLMYNASAMVSWADLGGKLNIKQYYLKGFKPESIIPDSGNLPLTKVPAAVAIDRNTMYLAFQLNYSSPISRQHILLAYGNDYPSVKNLLTHHNDKTTVFFDFATGKIAVWNNPISNLKTIHGVLGILGWGVLAPMGAISARYFKHKDPLWYYLHVTFQISASIIGMMIVVAGLTLYNSMNANFPLHRGIGIFVLVLAVIQLVSGFLRPTKFAKTRKYWNVFHHSVGRIAIIFGNLNIIIGILHSNDGTIWIVCYSLIICAHLITTIVMQIKTTSKAVTKKPEMIEISPTI